MNEQGDIIGDYRDGDLETRVCLYLAHRELRREFDRIDQHQTAAPGDDSVTAAHGLPARSGQPTGALSRLLRWCYAMMA